MTAEQAYKLFLLKINKNDTNADIHISRPEFVLLFNEEQRRWLSEKLNVKISSDKVNDLNELLVDFRELAQNTTHANHVDYGLPEDFFSIGSLYIIGMKGDCKKVLEPTWSNIKNIITLLLDQYSKPSFDWERTLITIADNKLQVYVGDFDIYKLYLAYFRMPTDVDLVGYIMEDGTMSVLKDPELQDMYVEQILNRCARHVIANYENPDGFQLREAIIRTEE